MARKGTRPPGRPRAEEIDKPTETTILDAAARLFVEYGYEGVSVESVAKAANVTKATVYYHYANKGSLFTSSMTHFLHRISNRMEVILQEPLPLFDRLQKIAEIRLAVKSPLLDFDGLMREAELALTKEQLLEMRRAEEAIALKLSAEFEVSMSAGEVRGISPLLAAHAYLSLLRLGKARTADGAYLFDSPEAAAGSLVKLLWVGIGDPS